MIRSELDQLSEEEHDIFLINLGVMSLFGLTLVQNMGASTSIVFFPTITLMLCLLTFKRFEWLEWINTTIFVICIFCFFYGFLFFCFSALIQYLLYKSLGEKATVFLIIIGMIMFLSSLS